MLFFNSEFSDKTETIDFLIKELGTVIYKIALTKLNNIRFGFTTYINYDKYEDAIVYRDILKDIMYCASGMCDVNIAKVVSRVKHIINTPC